MGGKKPRAEIAEPEAVYSDLMACEQCDWLHTRAELERGSTAYCVRCNAPLERAKPKSFDLILALTLADLVMLAVAHLNPVFGLDVQGQAQITTLWQAAMNLYREGAWVLSVLVVMTTFVFPFAQLLAICYLIIPLRLGVMPPHFARAMRVMKAVKPWVMVEVFMLGVLIAVVKLSSYGSILPGFGMVAFATVMLLLGAIGANFHEEGLWEMAEKVQPFNRN